MNRGNFDDETGADDEFFGELADSIELVASMTRDRLAGGELERRREEIMARIFGPATTEPADDSAPPLPPAVDEASPGPCVMDDAHRVAVRLADCRSTTHSHQNHTGDLRRLKVLDDAVARYLNPPAAAAMADAERYRDGALRRAADIVKQAQQQADNLLAEAQRTLDEARRVVAAGERRSTLVAAADDPDLLAAPPNFGLKRWSTYKNERLAMMGGSGRLLVEYPTGSGKTEAMLRFWAELLSPLGAEPDVGQVEVKRMRRLSNLIASPGCESSRLILRNLADAGHDAAALRGEQPTVLFQCKTVTGRVGLKRQLERLWSERHPLTESLLGVGDRRVTVVVPDARSAEVAIAVLAEIRCAWEKRGGHQADPRLAVQWTDSATVVGSENRGCGSGNRFMPALLQLAAAPSYAGDWLPILSPAQRLLLACDVEGFGKANASLQSRWQHAVRQIFGEAACQVGLDSHRWHRQRAGDGELAVLPPGASWRSHFEQLMGAVDRQLHEYNRYATEDARLRLRVAVHEGTVAATGGGFAGHATNTVTRLVDSSSLRRALDEHPDASMAVAVSEPVFREVTSGRNQEQDPYMRITIPPSKDTAEDAWVFVPDESMRYPGWVAPTDHRPMPRQRPQAPRQTAST